MALTSKIAKMLSRNSAESMERTKKFLGLPGYDEGTMAAQKELDDEIAALKKKEKSKELTAREEKRLDSLMNRKLRASSAERAENMPREGKPKNLSEKEKREMQESLEFSKGGMSAKKYARGGCSTKKMRVGGMANCGASVKPNGPKKGK